MFSTMAESTCLADADRTKEAGVPSEWGIQEEIGRGVRWLGRSAKQGWLAIKPPCIAKPCTLCPRSNQKSRRTILLGDTIVLMGFLLLQPMSQNYFLWIIGIIGFLALASYLTGAI